MYPIDVALLMNDLISLQLLLNFGADPNIHHSKMPILSMAIENNSVEAMKILIKNGALVDAPENSPVLTAVKAQNQQALEILVRSNADFHVKVENLSLLQYATKKKLSVVPYLQKMNLK